MKLYIVRTEMMATENTIDYSMILGVYNDKDSAKNAAQKALEEQAKFWAGSYARRDISGKELVRVVLTDNEHTKRYIIEAIDSAF